MDLIIETDRLILRELQLSDADALFEMDNNPNVHLYLGNEPVQSIDKVHEYIKSIQNQYIKNGIGRFAVVLKETNEVMGWAGIKFVTESENNQTNFYDIGFRLREKNWRKGYGLEAAMAWLDYGFYQMKIPVLIASAHIDNRGSNAILQKIGMIQKGQYLYDDLPCYWYELKNPN